MCFREFGVDNGQSQVEQEEGTNHDHWDKEDPNDVSVGYLQHCLDLTPAFHGYALEDSQE